MKFEKSVHVLTTKKGAKNINNQFLQDFNKELDITLTVGICKSDKEHRRFLILNDQKVIIIGCSLNSIDKNEVLSELKSSEDLDFFNTEWQNATISN